MTKPNNARSSEHNDSEDASFEDAFAELDSIVTRLESGELALAESVALYARGRALAAHCQALLDAAELHVSQLE